MKRKNNWQPIVFAGAIIIVLVFVVSNLPTDVVPDLGPGSKTADGECITNKDCRVAGCSGQICTTASEARGTFTTCEYRDEYDCLQYTSCGCNDGYCGWKENTEYQNCLAGLNE